MCHCNVWYFWFNQGHIESLRTRGHATRDHQKLYIMYTMYVYCIARNIGGDLILVNWQFLNKLPNPPKLKFNPLATTLVL